MNQQHDRYHELQLFLPAVLASFDSPSKIRSVYFDEMEKFWSINAFGVRSERNAGRSFPPTVS
jgi:hypothetical protein